MTAGRVIITGGTVVTPFEALPGHAVLIEGSRVEAILPGAPTPAAGQTRLDAAGGYVIPGLIDIHLHGGLGVDVMDATADSLRTLATFCARAGVTGFLATTLSATPARIRAALENVAGFTPGGAGARVLGVHIEGPYLTPEFRGAQPAHFLRDPDPAEYQAWLASGVVRLITVAPERPGALELIEAGARRGVEFAVGHSGATFDQVTAAADRGLRHATHTFNGMGGLHHREPGTVGSILTDDRIFAQVIADGHHLHPAIVRLIVRAKGPGRTVLVTDAVRAAGLTDGEYELAGEKIWVEGGVTRTAAGSLAGSTLTMDAALRNMAAFTGLGLPEVVRMATATPAESIGLASQKGRLAPGFDADVVVLDADWQVRYTLVGGQVVYTRAE